MKKYLISFLSVLMVIVMSLSMTGCGEEKTVLKTFLSYADQSFDSDISESGVVIENDNWSLMWDESYKRVSFVEKNTGAVWGQIPQEALEPAIQENGMIKKNHPQLE